MREWVDRFGAKRLALIGMGGILVLWLISGVFTVGASERGVVTTFGKVNRIQEPGLHYRLPWPIEGSHIVDVATVRRAEIGFSTRAGRPVLEEALMLTGDENIVHVELFVQYVVNDPVKFLFRVRDPEVVLRNAAEAALRSEVGQRPIEFTQTEGRVEVQDAVRVRLQTLLDSYNSGIVVTEARLLTVDPPEEVQDAFLEVVRAFEDRDRLVQEAEAYAARVVPEARGEAARMLQEAEGYKERRTLDAEGNATRFLLVLLEYRTAPQVTRERLYLEAIERALHNSEKIILDTAGGNALPLLPLRPLSGGLPPIQTEGNGE
jgi:modulator of FtsH protease HflK